jgi:Putative restriction endonuclease
LHGRSSLPALKRVTARWGWLSPWRTGRSPTPSLIGQHDFSRRERSPSGTDLALLRPCIMQSTLAVVAHSSSAAIAVRYSVRAVPDTWVLPEGTVPQSVPHNTAARHIEDVLIEWAIRTRGNVMVARELALRWLEQAPQIGIDPDVCLLMPPPPEGEDLSALCLWKPGHVAPPLCFEVVSANHPHKDYAGIQDRYASLGTRELVVFDPLLAGPAALGGPVRLQVWRRDELGVFERVHFSDEPAYSTVLDAWLLPQERALEISDDRQGTRIWPTAAGRLQRDNERERAEKERERAEKERERAAREALELRVAELEAKSRA